MVPHKIGLAGFLREDDIGQPAPHYLTVGDDFFPVLPRVGEYIGHQLNAQDNVGFWQVFRIVHIPNGGGRFLIELLLKPG